MKIFAYFFRTNITIFSQVNGLTRNYIKNNKKLFNNSKKSSHQKLNNFTSANSFYEKMRLIKDNIKVNKWYIQDLSISFIIDGIQ